VENNLKFRNLAVDDCIYYVTQDDLLNKKYALISINDEENCGYLFMPSKRCTEVLTLVFHDTDRKENGTILYTEQQAGEVLKFVQRNIKKVDEIIIHCDTGINRSAGMAAALNKIYNGIDEDYFKHYKTDMHVYQTTMNTAERKNKEYITKVKNLPQYIFWQG
jgi:predicted protein tyrosine phosphatase